METLKQQFHSHASDATVHLRGRERTLRTEDIRHRIEKGRGWAALRRQRARGKPKPLIPGRAGTPKRPVRRFDPERPQLRRTCLSDAAKAGEPAYATLNVADWQGSAPPPYDPLGFRAGFGAAEDRAASGTTYAPMAVPRRSAKPRLAIAPKPVARDPARLGAGSIGGRGGGAPRQPLQGHPKCGHGEYAGLATLTWLKPAPATVREPLPRRRWPDRRGQAPRPLGRQPRGARSPASPSGGHAECGHGGYPTPLPPSSPTSSRSPAFAGCRNGASRTGRDD